MISVLLHFEMYVYVSMYINIYIIDKYKYSDTL